MQTRLTKIRDSSIDLFARSLQHAGVATPATCKDDLHETDHDGAMISQKTDMISPTSDTYDFDTLNDKIPAVVYAATAHSSSAVEQQLLCTNVLRGSADRSRIIQSPFVP